VANSGGRQCLTLDFAHLDIDGLGLVAADVPATVGVGASGAVGSLLCNVAGLVGRPVNGAARGLVNAINNLI
jgi:hypothetical protein